MNCNDSIEIEDFEHVEIETGTEIDAKAEQPENELQRLRQENADMKQELKEMDDRMKSMRDENMDMKKRLEELAKQISDISSAITTVSAPATAYMTTCLPAYTSDLSSGATTTVITTAGYSSWWSG